MTDPDNSSDLSEARIAEILQKVSPRNKPSAEMTAGIKANVKDAWQQEVSRHAATQRRNRWVAVAASVCIAVGAGFLLNTEPTQTSPGLLAQVVGTIEYRADDRSQWAPANLATKFTPNTEIRSYSGSFAALSLANGMTLRLDESSLVRLDSDAQVYLTQGGIYAESDKTLIDQSLTINTEFGSARDIGTEFEVRVNPDHWRVQVREGLVNINDQQFIATAKAGERLVIAKDQTIEREPLSPSDSSWQWTHQVHQPFAIEGASLSAYLAWWSDETGRRIIFKNDEDQLAAGRTILHGSMKDLSVADSLLVVLSTTDFELVDSASDQVILAR